MLGNFFTDRNGNPMLMTGLQCHNSSTGSDLLVKAIHAVKEFHGNLLEAPVYWYWMEKEEGQFDLSHVRELIRTAREAGLYLVILWFATNKNGHPNYAPEYVKLNPEKYQLALGANGRPVPSMSPHCRATLEADKRAFVELMKCIRQEDENFGTVIAVQVENEAGLGGTDRDYSALAQEDFEKPVPTELSDVVIPDSAAKGNDNTWRGRFGRYANEAFTAWYQAAYINEIAAAGKEVYDLPMFVNAMLGAPMGEAGNGYNAGGPVVRMIDVWKKAAPSIDLLCPDIYTPAKDDYLHFCKAYQRPDNRLFIPESGFFGTSAGLNVIRAAAQFGAMGICAFGAESALNEDGTISEAVEEAAVSFRAVRAIAPLLVKYYGSGRIHAFIQEEFMEKQLLVLPDFRITATFGAPRRRDKSADPARGRGILVQTGDFEFFLAGDNIGLDFVYRPDPEGDQFDWLTCRQSTQLNFLSVEEGHFEGEKWVVDFYRNGDESNYALYARKGGIVRIRLNPKMGSCGKVDG